MFARICNFSQKFSIATVIAWQYDMLAECVEHRVKLSEKKDRKQKGQNIELCGQIDGEESKQTARKF